MSTGTITTEAELAALPERTAVVDRMGDVGTVLGGKLRYPETSPQTFERAAKKYGPFHIVYSPPVPEIEIGTTGTATVASGDAAKGRTFRKAHGMYVGAGKFVEPTGEGTFTVWYTEDWSGFAPDTAPTLAQIVDAMCAHDPEHGNGEVGTHTHSHDPADGECYWATTVGPQIAHLWTNVGAS